MINFVKVIESGLSKLGVTVKFTRMGRDDTRETEQISLHGFESRPVKDMVAVYAKTEHDGDDVIIGYLVKSAITKVGETRMFSTDNNGTELFSIHLKNNGTAEIGGDSDNMVRYSNLESAFNQLRTDFNSLVTIYNNHVHGNPSPGVITLPTSPAQASTADITGARINEIKTS